MADELDKLIDAALAGYSTAEPLEGLEGRIVRRVRAAEADRKRRPAWGVAIPAMAAAMLLVWALRPPKPAVPAAEVVKQPPARVEIAPAPKIVAVAPRVRQRTVRARKELPKRNVFPASAPLTTEERLLVQLARSHPEALAGQVSGEIEIKPIEIAPLQIDGSQE